jgi:hypothetical protein
MKVVGYGRCSTAEQAANGVSIEVQLRRRAPRRQQRLESDLARRRRGVRRCAARVPQAVPLGTTGTGSVGYRDVSTHLGRLSPKDSIRSHGA